jgi:phosphoglycerol transferase MdoB-like AlkP superfamily enzyme
LLRNISLSFGEGGGEAFSPIFTLLTTTMILRSLLYIIASILVIGWLLGFFYFKTSGQLIHILLVLAVISLIIGLFRKNGVE